MRYLGGVFSNECMSYYEGSYIKDLKYLNRNPKSIVVVDYSLENVKKHPTNTILVKPYDQNNAEDN